VPFLSLQDDQYPHLIFYKPPPTVCVGCRFSVLSLAAERAGVSEQSSVQAVSGTPRVDALEAGHWNGAHCLPAKGALCNFSATDAGVSTNVLIPQSMSPLRTISFPSTWNPDPNGATDVPPPKWCYKHSNVNHT
jgi:hypothetical protein